ncbi:ARM repeat-containing protein [Pseudovirgaria hyperparasitica]|uniref:ARM repeat-containing protein n=1 Tax=Pseudovirgaria hyperparasitica TaxID=470096 RepID=A0A6A6WHU8_9PEZI|nr:ARM repeat-containing protein [Pseudovirgaria hyperparasitica]KAF2761809.1 ARM repeat-containing protein [Pseudovirgaria hyperparasitica]
MEEQLVRVLAETQSPHEGPRKQAELQILQSYTNPAFPLSLISIASHDSVHIGIRQSALLTLRAFVLAGWSAGLDEFKGQVLVDDESKIRIRQSLLELATSPTADRKIKAVASYVVSKIASADYPDEWPDLLPTLLHLIPTANDSQLHGALKVLGDMVDESLSDDQFFAVARDLITAIHAVVADESKKNMLRALAVNVLRGCFDSLEIVAEDNKAAVRSFADEVLAAWLPFFLDVMKSKLPEPPSEKDEESETPAAEAYRGLLALKLQVVKCLMRIRSAFSFLLAQYSTALFSATWDELSSIQAAYHHMYIYDERQSRLEDSDGLPYTLDFLVLEELDFMQACLRAAPVRKELEKQLQSNANWVTEFLKLSVAFAQITTEEEGLWNIDVNIFLSEETSVTANYTPRTGCGDLVIKLGEWLNDPTIQGLLSYTQTLYSSTESWKAKESALFILGQFLGDYQDRDRFLNFEVGNGFIDYVKYAMQQPEEFLRARGYLVAGSLVRSTSQGLGQIGVEFLEATIRAINSDDSEVVKVSCIRAMQHYIQTLDRSVTAPLQEAMIAALSNYISAHDMADMAESEDLLVTFVESLRDAILLDIRVCFTGNGLDLLFTVASQGSHFHLEEIVNDTFDDVVNQTALLGPDAYTQLCHKVLPTINGAFDVGTLIEESTLTNLAASLLATLAEHGSEPLPQGFVAAIMPKLHRLLLGSNDDELLKAATLAVKNMIIHDYKQLFEWHDESGKGGLEVVLIIIDRLLGPDVDDNAAAEVGALAAEVVEKAGSERLGPFLEQLLKAVAIRLGSASKIQLIQSLTLVFARLSLVSAKEVVDFLAQVEIQTEQGPQTGLQTVLAKWLENSIHFVGYDEIRQNVIALSKLYELEDARLSQVQVKGDLIVPTSDRIMTRSRAKQSRYFSRSPVYRDFLAAQNAQYGSNNNSTPSLLSPTSSSSFPSSYPASMYSASTPNTPDFPNTPLSTSSFPSNVFSFSDEIPCTNNDSDPDQFAIIPAPLKILKVLVQELLSASGMASHLDGSNAQEAADDEADDDDGWEDDDVIDLGLGMTKQDLMGYDTDAATRGKDDETQTYLLQFFQGASTKPGFDDLFNALTPEEQQKLRAMSSAQ